MAALARRFGPMALALASTAFAMADASAAVVTVNGPINVPSTFDGLYLNLVTGASGSSGASTPGWDINPYNSGTALSFFWAGTPTASHGGVAGSATGPYLDLAPGTMISAASTFTATTSSLQTTAFQTPGTHTLGFRFFNESTSSINYGYMSLTSGGSNGFPLTINGWSYENSGGAISVAVIPEPGTGLMLAAGALAIGALRARRNRREA